MTTEKRREHQSTNVMIGTKIVTAGNIRTGNAENGDLVAVKMEKGESYDVATIISMDKEDSRIIRVRYETGPLKGKNMPVSIGSVSGHPYERLDSEAGPGLATKEEVKDAFMLNSMSKINGRLVIARVLSREKNSNDEQEYVYELAEIRRDNANYIGKKLCAIGLHGIGTGIGEKSRTLKTTIHDDARYISGTPTYSMLKY